MARRGRRRRGGKGKGEPIGPMPMQGPDPVMGPLPKSGPEPVRYDAEGDLIAPGDPSSKGFASRERPNRGRYFKKLSGRLRMAKRRGGRMGQAAELLTSLGSQVVSGRGLGTSAARVGALRSLAGLGGLAGLGYLAAQPAYDVITGETDLLGPGTRTLESLRLNLENAERQRMQQFRSQQAASLLENARMQQSIQENLQRVAQNNPALYNQIAAGRRLPRGAVVLGGQPRQDLLMELARGMDSGAFQQPDPLSELIG